MPTAARIVLLALFFSALPVSARTRGLEIQVSYGGWTAAPFHPILESRTEDAIRRSFESAVGSAAVGAFLSPLTARAEFGTGAGEAFSAVVWTGLGRSRFSLGFRADVFSFRLPFRVAVDEAVSLLGVPVARIEGSSSGTAVIRGFGGAVLGRWAAFDSRVFGLHLQAGLMLFPYEGTVTQNIAAVVRTGLGDINVSGPWDTTIQDLRDWSAEIPRAILSPLFAVEGRLRLFSGGGIFANLTLAQGTFMSAGMFLTI
jgi:hypothetical protein